MALEALEEEMTADDIWGDVKVLKELADCTIRRRTARRRKWMSEETWGMIKKRRNARLRSEASRIDDREIELARAE